MGVGVGWAVFGVDRGESLLGVRKGVGVQLIIKRNRLFHVKHPL